VKVQVNELGHGLRWILRCGHSNGKRGA